MSAATGIKIRRASTEHEGGCNFCRVHTAEVLIVERADPIGASARVQVCATCAKAIGAAVTETPRPRAIAGAS